MSAKAPTPIPEHYRRDHLNVNEGHTVSRPNAPSAPPPVRFEPWRTIEVPPSIRDHHAFDDLCERLARIGVRVVI